MKLNKQQIGYAIGRIEAAATARIITEVQDLLGEPPAEPALTFEEKHELIRTGKAKLRPVTGLNRYVDLVNAFEFPTFAKQRAVFLAAMKKRDQVSAKVASRINAEKQSLIDRVMLGDVEEALAALKEFESK